MSNTEKDDFSEINEYFAKVKEQKQKTKRQIACEPKEKTFTCEQCGEQFTAKTNHAKYCKDCAKQRQRERVKAYNENRKNLKVRELGSKDICTECGKEYIVVSGAQKVCEACRKQYLYKQKAQKNSEYISKAYEFFKLRFKVGEKEKLQEKLEEYRRLSGDELSLNEFILEAIEEKTKELDAQIEKYKALPF